MKIELLELKDRLAARSEDVCKHLLPGGKLIRDEWTCGSLNGEPGQSLKVNCNGKPGIWKDFATGEVGDNLLELWHQARGTGDLTAAIAEAKAFLGIVEIEKVRRSVRRSKPKAFAKPKREQSDRRLEQGGKVWRYLTEKRKLTPGTLKAFEVAEGVVHDDGKEWCAYVFPYKTPDGTLEHVKRIGIELIAQGKKRMSASTGTRLGLFGKNVVGESSPVLLITEGEIDALSWHQIGVAAVSVPNGATAHTWLENDFDYLDGFEQILIAFDDDEPGHKGAEELAKRIGIERVGLVELQGYKDANEALQAGDTEAMTNAYENPCFMQPEELVSAADFLDDAGRILDGKGASGIRVFFTDGWRVRPHEFTIWSGFSGHGKSVLLEQVIGDLCDAGQRAVIASFEQPPAMTLADMIRQRTREAEPTHEDCEKLRPWLADKLWFIHAVGSRNWHDVLDAFRYAWKRFGCTQFVIDSLLRCGIREDDYEGQKQFSEALADFVNQFPVHVHLVAHARKVSDEGKPPGKLDVRGAAAITDQCHNGITVWRNKKKAHEIEAARLEGSHEDEAQLRCEPDAKVVFWKQRATGEEPFSNLIFDCDTKRFSTT
jgi:twinkle protein